MTDAEMIARAERSTWALVAAALGGYRLVYGDEAARREVLFFGVIFVLVLCWT